MRIDQVIFDGSFGTATPAGATRRPDYLGIRAARCRQMRACCRQDERHDFRGHQPAAIGGFGIGAWPNCATCAAAPAGVDCAPPHRPHGWILTNRRRCGGPPIAAAARSDPKAPHRCVATAQPSGHERAIPSPTGFVDPGVDAGMLQQVTLDRGFRVQLRTVTQFIDAVTSEQPDLARAMPAPAPSAPGQQRNPWPGS